MWIHHEYYRFATLRSWRVLVHRRRICIHTRHREIVIGW
jgi:hypothetical protein